MVHYLSIDSSDTSSTQTNYTSKDLNSNISYLLLYWYS